MKGVIFTEFLEMVEADHGIQVFDSLVTISSLHSGGAYTSVGNYPHSDMLAMLEKLSDLINVSMSDLCMTFGQYLFKSFSHNYKPFFVGIKTRLQLLEGIESVIHSEVRKLYPEACLPKFECFTNESGLIMNYSSERPFADLAEGLIRGCIDHFSDDLDLLREPGPTGDAHSAKFVISKRM
jgi:hypothetical protein